MSEDAETIASLRQLAQGSYGSWVAERFMFWFVEKGQYLGMFGFHSQGNRELERLVQEEASWKKRTLPNLGLPSEVEYAKSLNPIDINLEPVEYFPINHHERCTNHD